MKKIVRFMKKSGAMAVASALLAALPYSVPALFPLSWIAFVPLMAALTRTGKRLRSDLFCALSFGLCYHLFTYWWFYVLYPMEFAGVSRPVAVLIVLLGWLGISVLHGSLFLLPGLLVHWAKKCGRGKALPLAVFCVSFLLAEWITELSPLAFPWIRVSLSQFRAPVLLQTASIWGVYGTDLLILAVNAALVGALAAKQNKKRLAAGLLAAVLFAGNAVYGAARLAAPSRDEREISVAALQGSILSGDKWADGSVAKCMETYSDLTKKAAKEKPYLIVWPETAVPVDLSRSYNEAILEEFWDLSEKSGASLLTGTFWTTENGQHNAAVLITKDGVSRPYAKRHLVPFGESVPYRAVFEKIFPFLSEMNLYSDELAAGTDPALFETKKGKIGAIICFESIFPGLARESVKAGAEVLTVVTNDSWYEDSPAVYQHLGHAVLRSIENGRSTVRAANSGVSALIDHRGRILSELGPLKKGVVAGAVPLRGDLTPYTVAGDAALPVSAGLCALWMLTALIRERRRHGRKK